MQLAHRELELIHDCEVGAMAWLNAMADWFWSLDYVGPSLVTVFAGAPLVIWALMHSASYRARELTVQIALTLAVFMMGFVLYTGADVNVVVDVMPSDHPALESLRDAQQRHDYAAVRSWDREWRNEVSAEDYRLLRVAALAAAPGSALRIELEQSLATKYVSRKQFRELSRKIDAILTL